MMLVVAHYIDISEAKNYCIQASVCTEIAFSSAPDDLNKILFGGR